MSTKSARYHSLRRYPWAFLITFSWMASITNFSALATDWPQFLGPARNGTSTETGLLDSWGAKGPAVVWQRAIGTGFSGPVVAGSKLIVFHRLGDQEVVECLEAATGKGNWKQSYATAYTDDYGKGDGPRSTPAIAEGRVFTLGAAGALHCLDLASGKVEWHHSLLDEYHVPKNFFGVGSSPLVEGGLVIVNVGGKGAGIVAFATDTGKEVWKATDDGASYASPVAAAIASTRHLFVFTRQGLVSLDPRTGAVRFSKPWRARINASVNAATPLVIGDNLFLSASYGTGATLLKVKADGVDTVWKGNNVLSNHYSTSVEHGGFLYGCDGRQEERARLRCVELQTGKVRWTKEGFGCASLLLVDGKIIALDERGDLVLFDANPGGYHEKARATVLARPCRAPLALSDKKLYARDDHRLLCLNLRSSNGK